MERETRLELATLALARRCSTTELLPLDADSSIPGRRNRVKPATPGAQRLLPTQLRGIPRSREAPRAPTVEAKFENGIIMRFEPVAEALSNRQERSSMGILLNPWSLIVIAVMAFLLFFTLGRTPSSK